MSQQTRADLQTKINTDLASGTNITAAELRGVLTNLNDSKHNTLTDGVPATTATKLDAFAAPDDTTTRDATTSLHGLMPKADKVKLDAIEAAADVTDAVNVGSSIHGATAKTTPVDADTMPLIDSAASNVLKKATWANIKATLKTYFDTIYEAINANIQAHIASTSNPHSVTKSQVGLANADNTSDAAKPVSTATQTALDLKAPLASPSFTGTVTLPGDPGSALHAATKQYVDGLLTNVGKRARARAATTANITIATALNDGDSLDGVTLATGDQVLVKNQTATEENGIYVVGTSPARAAEFDSYNEHPGSLIAVEEGTTNADTLWLCTSNDGGTIGVTAIAFSKMQVAGELLITDLDTDGTLAANSDSKIATQKATKTYADTKTTAAAALAAAAGIKLDDFAAPGDNTDLNASTSAHGLALKVTAPAAGMRNVHCVDNAETARKDAALFVAGDPAALGTAAAGTALTVARSDHVHALPALDATAAPTDITTRDATSSVHGLLPKLDKAKLDTLNAAEATVASGTTTDLGALTSEHVSITGTTTITGFGTVAAGTKRSGRFTGALTLTHNATSLILPGAANITTAAGDRFGAVSLGSGNWVVYWYTKADGTAVVGGGGGAVATDSIWDAKGDLVAGTGSNTAARIAAGANMRTMVWDSAETNGIRPGPVPQLVIPFSAQAQGYITYFNLPAAVGFFITSGSQLTYTGIKVDLTYYTQARMVAVKTSSAGAAGSKLSLRYITAHSTTPGDWSDIGTSVVEIAADAAAGAQDSGWINLASGAKADVFVNILGYGGDGAADPQWCGLTMEFR